MSPALTPADAAAFAACIEGGGVAVFPADTVYGLACDPQNREAVARLYEAVDLAAPLAEGDSVPGCMSFSGDPECPGMFTPLGLVFEKEEPSADPQTLFHSGKSGA